ncbi:MAG: ribonuclease HII [Brumimicrobium sp.]|nr:ribonuclease HII [Brumimicrobium sp.]
MLPFYEENEIEAGCDEAGRGCLAGPVVAAAVILPRDFHHPLLNDSKQLTPQIRAELNNIIKESAISYGVAFVDHLTIDKINILNASFMAMHLALNKLKTKPTSLLIDGNRFKPYKKLKHHCMIQGDGRFASIAAASILAKEARDSFMIRLHKKHPHYSWNTNKGYGTKEHRNALEKFGISGYHRKSFTLVSQPELDFDLKNL